MAEKSSFFNAELVGDEWDRVYNAEDYANYFSSFIGNGVFPNPSTNLLITSNNNMTITLNEGKAWINGYMYHNDSKLNLSLDPADGNLKRIDSVVIRLDLVNREIKAHIKKGVPSSSPAASALTRNAVMYELCIAQIEVGAGSVSILQSNINDTRLNNEVCGIVTQTIKEIDTAVLYNKLEAYIDEMGKDLEYWLNDFKDIIDGDVVANLTGRVLSLENKVGSGLTADNIAMSNGTSVEEAIEQLASKLENVKSYKFIEGQNYILYSSEKDHGAVGVIFTNSTKYNFDKTYFKAECEKTSSGNAYKRATLAHKRDGVELKTWGLSGQYYEDDAPVKYTIEVTDFQVGDTIELTKRDSYFYCNKPQLLIGVELNNLNNSN